jgi:hypothetical protein
MRYRIAEGSLKQKPPQSGGFCDIQAEGERFELSDDLAVVNGFRDRPVQPLRHPSEGPR